MHELYRTAHKMFVADKPELGQELDKGLVLAICGYIHQTDRFLFQVGKYTISMEDGSWQCNCTAYDFASIRELYGHTGKICKHICAVAIAFSVKVWANSPANVFETVKRFIDMDYVFDCQLPNSKVKLIVNDNQLIIKVGRKKSGVLAHKLNKWEMTIQAKQIYEDYVKGLSK